MLFLWIAFTTVTALCVGYNIGRINEARYWVMKGNPIHRSAVCRWGRFYYVVPESEYVKK